MICSTAIADAFVSDKALAKDVAFSLKLGAQTFFNCFPNPSTGANDRFVFGFLCCDGSQRCAGHGCHARIRWRNIVGIGHTWKGNLGQFPVLCHRWRTHAVCACICCQLAPHWSVAILFDAFASHCTLSTWLPSQTQVCG